MNTLNKRARDTVAQFLDAYGMDPDAPSTNWVAGQLVQGTGESITLLDPSTGLPLLQYQDAGHHMVDKAVKAAVEAQKAWIAISASERGRRLQDAARGLEGHEESLARLESLIAGKPVRDCRGEVGKVREMFEYYAGWCDKQHGEVIDVPTSHLNYVQRIPYGVVGQITPWNAPMFTCGWQLAPALAAGNAAVLKPSELTPLTSAILAMLLEQGGRLPRGLIGIVNGLGHTTGKTLTSHPDIAKLVFVGSPETGRRIAEAGAQRLVPSVLELGGKSANIIFEDAAINDAVSGAQAAIFAAAGQSCVAGSRLLLQESLMTEFPERLARAAETIAVGLPDDEATRMGPLQNAAQLSRVHQLIDEAVAQGATLLTGGKPPTHLPAEAADGYFLAPTILTDVTPDMAIANEEVFGPVLVIMPFQDEEDAVALANGTRFGLAGAVWSRDTGKAMRVAHQLRVGTVWINSYKTISVMSPFGGFGDSGYGRSSGPDGLHEYSVPRSVWVETAPKATAAMGYGDGQSPQEESSR
ncbi:aldehyde dehydrogenase family protein [Vreelandella gomseomensis]|uniref:Aldehyde dehydrogenase family protein n=1 Tax=Vreelandella gomseomensis TaxID=370766 RepID=A0ABU1GAW0_9GAMM|nr:aldehyde dehydrogenase family protein [Halomonas gomseomensis]MDR5874625.1 aldehyde dehydrogenase family protein [Halomonas gomseomensis]